jgi:methionine aminotransferase
MNISSKLPKVGTTIFTVMSALAQEHNAINLAQGFPDFPSSDHLNDLVTKYLKLGYNQYAPMAGLPILRERIAEKIEGLYGVSVDPQTEITITAGATQAIFTAIATFIRPGDEVVIFEPAYDCYRPTIELFGGTAKAIELEPPEYAIDWERLKKMVNVRTRMIIINTPNNPSGTILKADDLIRLEQLTKGTEILLLSDEVYEHLVYDGETHQTALLYPGLRERTLAVYSFGKTFHNTGWKIGYCVAPPALTAEFRKVHQFNVFCVNSPMQYALAEFLEDPHEYLGLSTFYNHKRDFFLDSLEGSRLKPIICAGTYFLLCDYSQISQEPDTEFAKRMTQEYGVAAIPVSVFYNSPRTDHIIRLCFAKKESTLEAAGLRLKNL